MSSLSATPSTILSGGTTALRGNVQNIGADKPYSSIRLIWDWWGPQTNNKITRFENETIDADNLVRGMNKWDDAKLTITIPGVYTIQACVDPDYRLPESVETDNCAAVSVTVLPSGPDFAVATSLQAYRSITPRLD